MAQVVQQDSKTLAEKGQQIYEEKLKAQLEPRYRGQIVAIEVETGDYFVGDSVIEAARRAKAKYPDKVFYFVRVGYKAVHTHR